jgi:hypothetical protein
LNSRSRRTSSVTSSMKLSGLLNALPLGLAAAVFGFHRLTGKARALPSPVPPRKAVRNPWACRDCLPKAHDPFAHTRPARCPRHTSLPEWPAPPGFRRWGPSAGSPVHPAHARGRCLNHDIVREGRRQVTHDSDRLIRPETASAPVVVAHVAQQAPWQSRALLIARLRYQPGFAGVLPDQPFPQRERSPDGFSARPARSPFAVSASPCRSSARATFVGPFDIVGVDVQQKLVALRQPWRLKVSAADLGCHPSATWASPSRFSADQPVLDMFGDRPVPVAAAGLRLPARPSRPRPPRCCG